MEILDLKSFYFFFAWLSFKLGCQLIGAVLRGIQRLQPKIFISHNTIKKLIVSILVWFVHMVNDTKGEHKNKILNLITHIGLKRFNFYMYILETMYCHTLVISKLLNNKISSETYLKAPIAKECFHHGVIKLLNQNSEAFWIFIDIGLKLTKKWIFF